MSTTNRETVSPIGNTSTTNARPTPIALVTGGSRGLGKSIALNLADRGADVILTFQHAEKEAHDVVRAIEAKGRKAVALPLDLGSTKGLPTFVSAVASALERVFGKRHVDWLVNNAGSGLHSAFAETTEEQFDAQLAVHFRSVFFLTQKLLPHLADGGRIVNVSSGLSRYTYPGLSVYAAMKGAVEVLTRYLARELGPRGITVNVVAPGGIETDFGGGVMKDPALQKIIAEQTALGRVGVPDDIGGIVAALLAPESRWVTGQRLEVTGGYSL